MALIAEVKADDVFEQTEFFRLVLGEATATGDRLILPGDVPLAVIVDDDPADVAPTVDAGADVDGTEGAAVAVNPPVSDDLVLTLDNAAPQIRGLDVTVAPDDTRAVTVGFTDAGDDVPQLHIQVGRRHA